VAVRLATAAAASGRPSVAVTTAPLDDRSVAAVDHALREDAPVVIEVWSDTARLPRAEAHAEQLAAALASRSPRVLEVPVCADDTERLVAAAGPVVAWGGLSRVGAGGSG
jgi:hypothetical protein